MATNILNKLKREQFRDEAREYLAVETCKRVRQRLRDSPEHQEMSEPKQEELARKTTLRALKKSYGSVWKKKEVSGLVPLKVERAVKREIGEGTEEGYEEGTEFEEWNEEDIEQ